MKTPDEASASPAMMTGSECSSVNSNPADVKHTGNDRGQANPVVIEAAARQRRHNQSQQIHEEDAAQLLGVQVIRRSGEIEVGVGEGSDQAKQRRKSHPEDGEQARIAQVLPAFGERMRDAGRAHKALRSWQRSLHDDRSRKVDDPDDKKCVSPRKMMRYHARDVASQKAAQHRPRNVC